MHHSTKQIYNPDSTIYCIYVLELFFLTSLCLYLSNKGNVTSSLYYPNINEVIIYTISTTVSSIQKWFFWYNYPFFPSSSYTTFSVFLYYIYYFVINILLGTFVSQEERQWEQYHSRNNKGQNRSTGEYFEWLYLLHCICLQNRYKPMNVFL